MPDEPDDPGAPGVIPVPRAESAAAPRVRDRVRRPRVERGAVLSCMPPAVPPEPADMALESPAAPPDCGVVTVVVRCSVIVVWCRRVRARVRVRVDSRTLSRPDAVVPALSVADPVVVAVGGCAGGVDGGVVWANAAAGTIAAASKEARKERIQVSERGDAPTDVERGAKRISRGMCSTRE